jgi:hypothetical protein
MEAKSNRRWKWAFFACLLITILSNGYFIYALIDAGITKAYADVGYEDQRKANEVLGSLIVKGSKTYSQRDFLVLLRQAYPKEFIVEEGSKITMGPNSFTFENDRLVHAR